ncbi:hypothetical protein AB0N14_17880 [Streptomyces sp. NPDC051104]|uniref:hypothetical protein n=1 Tax=Streptomyces sp. NPDC051104 TaxID=3155044 RepID=UPI00343EC59E
MDVLFQAATLVAIAAEQPWWEDFRRSMARFLAGPWSPDFEGWEIAFQRLDETRASILTDYPPSMRLVGMNAARKSWERYFRQNLPRNTEQARKYLQQLNRLLDYYQGRPNNDKAQPVLWRQPEQSDVEEAAIADEDALAAVGTVDAALARLFVRLGPPPEPSSLDYAPIGGDGGGAQQ